MPESKRCESDKVKVLGRCIKADSNQIYAKFLENAEKNGIDHRRIDKVVRNTFVATSAEVEAGKQFYNWVLEDIGNRYKIIGGKTWRAGEDMLFPSRLVEQRRGLNMHLWDEYPKVN